MATATLSEDECFQNLLPAVCARCGAPADTTVRRVFAWFPPWVPITMLFALLPFIVLAMILTHRMTVRVPFCAKHQKHWATRTRLTVVTSLGIAGLLVVATVVPKGADMEPAVSPLSWVAGGLVAAAVVAWLVTVVALQHTMIKAAKITADSITLANVHPRFTAALEAGRAVEDELDDAYPATKWNRRGDG